MSVEPANRAAACGSSVEKPQQNQQTEKPNETNSSCGEPKPSTIVALPGYRAGLILNGQINYQPYLNQVLWKSSKPQYNNHYTRINAGLNLRADINRFYFEMMPQFRITVPYKIANPVLLGGGAIFSGGWNITRDTSLGGFGSIGFDCSNNATMSSVELGLQYSHWIMDKLSSSARIFVRLGGAFDLAFKLPYKNYGEAQVLLNAGFEIGGNHSSKQATD